MAEKKSNQLKHKLLNKTQKLQENKRIIVAHYLSDSKQDDSNNYNLFNSYKFKEKKQKKLFKDNVKNKQPNDDN